MLDVAVRRLDGTTAVELGGRSAPPLPVHPALADVLPGGLRRGSTVSVSGSVSLLLAMLGAASADGAWCALVGMPRLSAEAMTEYGLSLRRLAVVPQPGPSWTTAVGALLDAVDVVVVRPARVTPGDVRRLAARARTRDAVLVPYLAAGSEREWPGADVRLHARPGPWSGAEAGSGRLRTRRVEVDAGGRGQAARGRRAELWLPAAGGGIATAAPEPRVEGAPLAPVADLSA